MSGFVQEHYIDSDYFNSMQRTFDTHGYTRAPDSTLLLGITYP